MDWNALSAYVRATQASARMGAEPSPERNALHVTAEQIGWNRSSATYLDRRLPEGSFVQAASPGLQDSAPRSGLLSLHARVNGCGPSAWEDEALVQIWFRHGADYVVPRCDVRLFTLGTMPRDPAQRAALDELGDVIVRALDDRPRRTRDVEAMLPDLPSRHLIRIAAVTGKIHIRWDARTTHVLPAERWPAEPIEADLETCRLELARRFLHCYGPATAAQFAKWARVPRADALATWKAIGTDLIGVDVDGRSARILSSDEHALRGAHRPSGVRLLPHGDPYRYLDEPPPAKLPGLSDDVPQRLINSLSGRTLVDGAVVGAWGRVQTKVSLFPWVEIGRDTRERIDAEAEKMSGVLGAEMNVRWLD